MSTTQSAELAIVGAGPGGYAAAFLAADLGMEVVLIDLEANPGGVCLYRGCIPSKALLHVAKVITESHEAARWGVHFEPPRVDLDRLRAWKEEVVGKLTGGLGELAKRRKIQYVRGRAQFDGPGALVVDGVDGTLLRFKHAILATGSRAATLPGIEIGGRVLNSSSALKLETVPDRLLVVGGGYIGLELGTVYAALGSRVTVVELTGSLLPGVDSDLVRPLARRLEGAFEAIHVNTRVAALKETSKGVKVTLVGENLKEPEQTYDRVLVSVGRKPNTADLGLDSTRIQASPQGFVQVDEQRRTAEPAVFAIGDVVGQPMLAHKASHEGRTAVQVIAGKNAAFAPAAIPAVVFTDPEIAWCGLTEGEAKAAGRKVEVARFPWAASGRATTLDRPDGLTKLLVDPGTERVLGVGLCGPGAGELIAEGVLAIEMGATVEDLDLSIHPHPTLSETLMEAAASFFGTSTHVYRPRRG